MKNIIDFEGKSPVIDDSCFIAENSTIIGDVEIGKGGNIWFGAVLRGDVAGIRMGENCNVQDNSVVHVSEDDPVVMGDNVTVGHTAIIHGCTIEDDCLIGMGAIVMDKAVIGKGSTIGAGAIVTSKTVIPPYSVAVGSPAKVIKNLGEDGAKANAHHAQGYVELGEKYKYD